MRDLVWFVYAKGKPKDKKKEFPYCFDNKEEADKFCEKVKGKYSIECRVNNNLEEGLEEYEYFTDIELRDVKGSGVEK